MAREMIYCGRQEYVGVDESRRCYKWLYGGLDVTEKE